jgi:serine/threonine protein kinase/Tol biopolymer transport system component
MPVVGKNFQRYKVLSLIGSGGMGEVYLARDGQLGRNVALKVLKPNLSHKQSDALERFMLEARSASALNHPNIITIYEIGEAEGSHYIASEFVDGKTLHERINRRSLSLTEMLTVAIQIGEALAAAHSAGIVHRDIKPENIMVRDDGYVKVLDFGLAKLTEYEMQMADVDADTLVATSPGIVMGTVSYMSPEQARGKTIDQRTDIWSLGVVLYEMLTGERPFRGETTSDTVAAILRSEPEPISPRFPETPLELERIVAKALRKNFDERYQTIRDMLVDLRELRRELDAQMRSGTASFGLTRLDRPAISTGNGNLTVESTWPVTPGTNSLSSAFLTQFKLHPILLTAIIIVALGGVAAVGWAVVRAVSRHAPANFESMRFSKLTSSGTAEGGLTAVSPDGKYVAYVSRENGRFGLWIRQVGTSGNVQVVPPGNISYTGLTFSNDGNYIYFTGKDTAGGSGVYFVATLGGESRKLVSDASEGTISFSRDGAQFAFVRSARELVVADANGNNQHTVAYADAGQAFVHTAWCPDGRTIVTTAYSADDNNIRLVAISVADGSKTLLGTQLWRRVSGIAWLPDDENLILTGRDLETQISQVWKVSRQNGSATRITNDLSNYNGLGISADGKAAVSIVENRLSNIWVVSDSNLANAKRITSDAGREEGVSGIAWTADGRIVYTTRMIASQDLWIVDPASGDNRQLTFDAGANYHPAVTPDGKTIVFVSTRTGNAELWKMGIDGGNPVQVTHTSGIEARPVITPDGKWIIFDVADDNRSNTIWKLPIDGGQAIQLTEVRSLRASISPDGKQFACLYGDNANGARRKVAVISIDGGPPIEQLGLSDVVTSPFFKWAADGRSLVYLDAISHGLELWGQPLDGGPRTKMVGSATDMIYNFDESRNGKGFAFARGNETSDAVMITNF